MASAHKNTVIPLDRGSALLTAAAQLPLGEDGGRRAFFVLALIVYQFFIPMSSLFLILFYSFSRMKITAAAKLAAEIKVDETM